MGDGRTSRLLLVRHCAALHQGPEAPLTVAGARAAELLATRLESFGAEAVYSSPIASRHELAIVASHGQWISAVLHHVDRAFAFEDWRELQNPDLFVVSWKNGIPLGFQRMTTLP